MEQTENYLNKILQKRIGSVVNQSSFSKNATSVSRVPKQEEKLQAMPTVFRQKHQATIYNNSQIPLEYRSSTMIPTRETVVEQKPPVGNQRVQYMAISKRIQQKKEFDFISPTVDVSKYRTTYLSQNLSAKQLSKQQINGPSKQEQGQLKGQLKQDKQVKPRRRKIFN